jgi:hypothetical protein
VNGGLDVANLDPTIRFAIGAPGGGVVPNAFLETGVLVELPIMLLTSTVPVPPSGAYYLGAMMEAWSTDPAFPPNDVDAEIRQNGSTLLQTLTLMAVTGAAIRYPEPISLYTARARAVAFLGSPVALSAGDYLTVGGSGLSGLEYELRAFLFVPHVA